MHNLGAKIHTKKSHREKWHNFPKKSLHKFSISFVHPAKRSKQNFFRCKSNQLLIQQKNFERESKLENVAAFVRFQNKESSIKMFQFLRKILFEPKNAVSVPEKSFFKKFLVLQKKKDKPSDGYFSCLFRWITWDVDT